MCLSRLVPMLVIALGAIPGRVVAQACGPGECGNAWLAEVRLGAFLITFDSTRASTHGAAHIGYLFATGDGHAFGAALAAGGNDIGGWAGAEARYRGWLGPGRTFDVGFGVAPLVSNSLDGPTVFGSVGGSIGDFGAVLHFQTLRELDEITREPGKSTVAGALVAQLDGTAGLIVAAVAVAVVFVVGAPGFG